MSTEILNLLGDQATVVSTCIDLFTLATFFSLEGLRQRAVEVLTEYFIYEAYSIQTSVRLEEELEGVNLSFCGFVSPYLEGVRKVYSPANSDELQPLKATFLLYVKLTRYIALRDELLGEKLRTDPELADFLTDILKATFFRPFGKLKENEKGMRAYEEMESLSQLCKNCDKHGDFMTEFGDTVGGHKQEAWCRKCKPLGEENVMKLLGADKPGFTRKWRN